MRLKIWLLIIALVNCGMGSSLNPPSAVEGVLDLREWNFSDQPSIKLSGDWEFYWKEFVNSRRNQGGSAKENFIYLAPGTRWEGLEIGNSQGTGIGYATYRLKLCFSEEQLNNIYSLKFKTTGGLAYRIILNDEILAELGKVATGKEEMKPTRESSIIHFTLDRQEMDLIVQMSNFYHADGNFWYAPELGLAKKMTFFTGQKHIIDAVMLGMTIMMSLYHLTIYYLRRQEKTSLYFGLFCLTISVYNLLVNEVFIYFIFPEIPFSVAHRLLVLSYLVVPLYLHFLFTVFPDEFPRKLLIFFWILFGGIYAFIFLNKLEYGTIVERPAIYPVAIAFLYSFLVVFRAVLNRRLNSGYMLLPSLVLLISILNDIVSIYSYFDTPIVTSYSVFFFVVFQSLMLAKQYSKVTNRVESLSEKLLKMNMDLENTVQERTRQFKEEKEIAVQANLWKNKFISLVSHDLRSPLLSIFSILSLVESDTSLTEEEKLNFIKHAKSTIFNSTSTVKHLLNLSRFQNQNLKVVYEDVDVGVLIQNLEAELHSEIIRKNISFENNISEDTILTVDKQITIEICRNIIVNAIKFCREGDHIKIDFKEDDSNQIIIFEDSGIGISAKVQGEIFKTEVSTIGTLGEKGFGIGLKLCNELMVLHGGKIDLESIEGQGSKFSLYFPTNRKTVLIFGDSTNWDDLIIGLENIHCLPILESDASNSKTRISELNFLCMILLDSLKDTDIEEIVHGIREEFLMENKPIVICKANHHCLRNGAENIFLAKDSTEIIRIMEKILSDSQAPI